MGTGDIWQLDRRKKAETNPRWNKRWLSIIWCFPVARPFHFCRMTIATWTLITCFDELNDSQTFWQRQLSWPGCLMSLNWLPLHMFLSNFIQIHSNLVQILVLQIWTKFEWIWMKFERKPCIFAVLLIKVLQTPVPVWPELGKLWLAPRRMGSPDFEPGAEQPWTEWLFSAGWGQETYDSLTGEKRLKQTHVETNGDCQSFDVFRWQGPSTSAGWQLPHEH